MRRVVVTGMGIVSSIGNNTQEVLASLREAKSGIVRAEKYAELGFRCQVHGAPQHRLGIAGSAQAEALHGRRASAGTGSPWSRRSATPAWRSRRRQRAHRHHHGRRAALDARHRRRRRHDAREGPQEGRPLRGAEGACARDRPPRSPPSFQIKGVNYSISSACSTSAHCIGNAAELIQWGKQDIMFAGGCEELDWTLSVLFDAHGRHVDAVQRHARKGQPRLRQEPRRLRHRRRRRRRRARGTASTPRRAGRASTARSPATAPRPTASTWSPRRAKAPCAACSWR